MTFNPSLAADIIEDSQRSWVLQAQRSLEQLQTEKSTIQEELNSAALSLVAAKEELNVTKQVVKESQLKAAQTTAALTACHRQKEAVHEHHVSLQSRAESAEAACAVAELLHEDHLEQMQVSSSGCTCQ